MLSYFVNWKLLDKRLETEPKKNNKGAKEKSQHSPGNTLRSVVVNYCRIRDYTASHPKIGRNKITHSMHHSND